MLQTPLEAALAAALRRIIPRGVTLAERAIAIAIPDLGKRPLIDVPKNNRIVGNVGERGNTTW
jgi:hypothetical protein